MKKFFLQCISSLLITTTATFAPDAQGSAEKWTPLFNGKDLSGWVQKGGAAKFRAENGEIIGTTVPNTANSFLCTERDYANFILELEFKVADGLNSGVQIRSRAADTATTEDWNGKIVKIAAGRVHGLQVEIDPSKRAWTGGIQGEGGIGWLNDLTKNDAARAAFKAGEWNKMRIEARGDSIKTWLNGVPAADLKNDVIKTGFIALQVHSVGKKEEPLEVRFRDLRLQELP
jgi:hypothetical protein